MSSSTMAIARAFTKRNKRAESITTRGTSVKYAPGTIDRNMISLPTELISTTNVQALTAPDIRSLSGSSSTSLTLGGGESDFSTIDRSFLTKAGSDTSSIDSSGPATPITPADGVKSFFDTKEAVPAMPSVVSSAPAAVPEIPQRAPSHSKKAHVELSRKKSIQRMSPPPTAISKPAVRNEADLFSSGVDQSHPFGKELAQVKEMAEEFGATTRLLVEEEQDLARRGLCKFGVEEYLDEIAGLYGGVFEGNLTSLAKPWI